MAFISNIALNGTNYQIKDTQARTKSMANKRIVFISDSYGTYMDETGKNFVEIIKSNLGLSDSQVIDIHLGSSGFTRPGNQKWLTMLQNAAIAIPETITDIYCVGGANDDLSDYATVTSAIAEFMTYCKTTFINAVVTLAHVGLTFTPEGITHRDTVIPAYRECSASGACYMANSEYILCNNKYMGSDHVHPTQAGVRHLGNYLTNGIITGFYDVHYRETANMSTFEPSTVTYPGIISLDNGIAALQGAGAGGFGYFNFSSAITLSSLTSNFLKFATSYLCGDYANGRVFALTAKITSTGGTNVYPCTLYPHGLDSSGNVVYGLFIQMPSSSIAGVSRVELYAGTSTAIA